MPRRICVDASLVVKLVLAEADSSLAQFLWQKWIREEVDLVAPPLLIFESVSAIRVSVARRQITPDVGDLAFQRLMITIERVRFLAPADMHARAWQIAKQHNQNQIYDSYYLALAESLGCEFWTADVRLYNSLATKFSWMKYLAYSAHESP